MRESGHRFMIDFLPVPVMNTDIEFLILRIHENKKHGGV